MFNIARPKPFFYEADKKAVLLLHGLTGTPQDLKKIASTLKDQGYSCYAPIYSGHGLGAEALLKTTPAQWWHDALDALKFLEDKGYPEVAVIGHSMGGIFTLKIAEHFQKICFQSQAQLKGIVTLCSPVQQRNPDELINRVFAYGMQYKKLQRKDAKQIEYEVSRLKLQDTSALLQISRMSAEAGHDLNDIKVPTFVIQGSLDAESYKRSARLIFAGTDTRRKYIKFYENSGHLIMYDNEKDQLSQDIARFLNSLDWDE